MEMKESETPWIGDDAFFGSTRQPDVVQEDSRVTLAVFLMIAVVTIALLFALGIFIDCRHQKMDDEEAKRRKALRKLKIKIPKMKDTLTKGGDKDCIIEDMEENEATTSNGIV